jgi:chemotaxis protein MotB
MRRSQDKLFATIIPILILVSVAAAGWYYYYEEVNKNQSLTADGESEQTQLNLKLETLQTTINKLLADEKQLQAKLASEMELQQQLRTTIDTLHADAVELQATLGSEKKSQQELTNRLEKTTAEKLEMEANLQREVNRVNLTTAELEAELERRQAAQKSLSDEITTVTGEKSQLQLQLEQEQKSKKQIANLKSRLEQELNESRVEISQLKNQMTVIKLTSEVLFSSGSAEIKPAGKKVLSLIAESLNAYPDRAISVEGHTDNVPVTQNSRYESNWALSTARGLAAVNFFQQNNQVDPERLKVVGHGQYRPVSSNKTAEGRKLNRRIEIRMLPPNSMEIVQN